MASKENACPNGAPDMFYVPEKSFVALKAKLDKGSAITDKEVDVLVNWTCKNQDMVIPVDMNGAGHNMDDFEAALKDLGAAKCVECFVKARAHFEANKHQWASGECPGPMTAKQWKIDNDEEDEEEEEEFVLKYKPDLCHLPKTAWQEIKAKLAKKQEITKAEVDALVNWTAGDDEILVPVDTNGCDEDLDDFEEMLAKLGPQVVAQNFLQAEKHLEKMRDKIDASSLKEVTIKQWNAANPEEDEDDEDEGSGDEEDADDDDDEEEGDDEPPAKKAKKA